MDILAEMGHEDLKQIGIHAYGHRHKLIKVKSKILIKKKINVNHEIVCLHVWHVSRVLRSFYPELLL